MAAKHFGVGGFAVGVARSAWKYGHGVMALGVAVFSTWQHEIWRWCRSKMLGLRTRLIGVERSMQDSVLAVTNIATLEAVRHGSGAR